MADALGDIEATRRVDERHPVDGTLRASLNKSPFGSPTAGLSGDAMPRGCDLDCLLDEAENR